MSPTTGPELQAAVQAIDPRFTVAVHRGTDPVTDIVRRWVIVCGPTADCRCGRPRGGITAQVAVRLDGRANVMAAVEGVPYVARPLAPYDTPSEIARIAAWELQARCGP